MTQHTALVAAVRAVLNAGTSQRTLAKTAGVSHATISKLMSGESLNVSLKTYQRLMNATESDMKTITTTHDHAAATLADVENAALQRGVDADVGLRDTELECAKYRRMMALEAELDAWQLKCGKERDKSESLQLDLNKCEALARRTAKDLQIMTASWKAVSVERDTLERSLSHREQQAAKDAAMILGLNMSNDGLQAESKSVREQLNLAYSDYTKLSNRADKAYAFAWASGIALLLIVVQAAFMAFGGGV